MLNENPNIEIITPSFASFVNRADWPNPTYLHEDQPWPHRESELGFTEHRWDEYRRLFKKIKLEDGMRRKDELTEAVFFTASTDFTSNKDGDGVVTEKGMLTARNRSTIGLLILWTTSKAIVPRFSLKD